ncbi:MAG: hypothetical protein WCI03_05050 [bacterium]|jgi:hypothetical protein
MSTGLFEIGTEGVDVQQIMADIHETVAAKMQSGAYAGAQLARAERFNLMNMKKDENFFDFYMESLREAVFIDINDFEIRERRAILAPLLVKLKRTIWNLLKFYTYRLWSQQNQVNGLLLSATEEVDRKYRDKIKALEDRILKLESKLPTG